MFTAVVDPALAVGGTLGDSRRTSLIWGTKLSVGAVFVGGTLQRMGASAVAKGEQGGKARKGQ